MSKYKVKKVNVIPNLSNKKLYQHPKCYIGISMNNDFYWNQEKLEALLLWADKYFNQCLIVIGDHINRINEQIFRSLDEEESLKKSLEKGDRFIEYLEDTLKKIPVKSIIYKRWNSLYVDLKAEKIKEKLIKAREINQKFNESVYDSAREYINRKVNSGHELHMDFDEAINLSSIYIIEEISCFNELVKNGWDVELYPGQQLKVLKDISKGIIQEGMPLSLRDRIFVQLRVRKRSWAK